MDNPTTQNQPQPVAASREADNGRLRRFRFSPVGLLGALALLFVVTPFVEDLRHADQIEAMLLTLVFISAVLAVGARRRTLAVAALLDEHTVVGQFGYDLAHAVFAFQPGARHGPIESGCGQYLVRVSDAKPQPTN